jgi:nucleotide-binding universal stress UspA family protein
MSASAPPDAIVGDIASRPLDHHLVPPTGSMVRRSGARARPARILVALHGERSPQRALSFADRLATSLGAELHVLRVIPPAERISAADDVVSAALRDAQRVLAAGRRTRALCDSVLSTPLPNLHVCVRLGSFVEQVAQRACELDALLIGLPATKSPLAATAIRVAREADRPVIVTRGRPDFRKLLAATDLEDGQVPLLRKAAQLGHELAATVVAMHGVLSKTSSHADLVTMNGSRSQLERATRFFDAPFERVVVQSSDLARCILEQATAQKAGLIVVGVRPHVARAHPSTAAKLLRRARGPVLVAPLGPAPLRSAPPIAERA